MQDLLTFLDRIVFLMLTIFTRFSQFVVDSVPVLISKILIILKTFRYDHTPITSAYLWVRNALVLVSGIISHWSHWSINLISSYKNIGKFSIWFSVTQSQSGIFMEYFITGIKTVCRKLKLTQPSLCLNFLYNLEKFAYAKITKSKHECKKQVCGLNYSTLRGKTAWFIE